MPRSYRGKFSRKAFKFFLENGAYCEPPGRVVCAANLARAEKWAQDHEIQFGWMHESWSDAQDILGDLHKCTKDCDHEVLWCAIDSGGLPTFYNTGGIVDPDRNYRRVVEAELAAECLADLKKEARKLTEELLCSINITR